jgi:glycosyltransferase involved in cell wall biosynthesis
MVDVLRNTKKYKNTFTLFYVADGVSLDSTVGDIVHVKEVVFLFCKKGIRTTLLVRGKSKPEYLSNRNLSIKLVPSLIFPMSFVSYFRSLMVILSTLLFERPSLVYVRDTGINFAVAIAKLLRIPVMLEINGDLTKEYSRLPLPLAFLVRSFLSYSYTHSNRIVIPSQKMLIGLKKLGVDSQHVYFVPNGVNPTLFRPIDKSVCRAKFCLDNAFYFCFVGHLAQWQGVDLAINAFSMFLQDNPDYDAKLLIVGRGEMEQKLKTLTIDLRLESKVIFLGSIPHDLVPYALCASDVCIAPFVSWRNKDMGLSPLKQYEYLSCGKPIITTSITGTEVVANLNYGIRVKNAFKDALKNLPKWEKESHNIHKIISEHYSWDCRVEEIICIMRELTIENRYK